MKRWSSLDFGLYSFLAINPLALGLWTFSLAPLVGGNLVVAVILAGVVLVLGAIVFGSLADHSPWRGGDYAWQTRLLGRGAGVFVALVAWCLVVPVLAPVYGNLLVVEALDPLLTELGWDGTAAWFRERDGIFAGSLIAIAIAATLVGIGLRSAAIVQRILVVIGGIAFLVVLGLLVTSSPASFARSFDKHSAEIYGTGNIVSSQIVEIGKLDPRVSDVDVADTLRLVPLLLLFCLWIGWGNGLVADVRTRTRDAFRATLVRVATMTTLVSLLFLVSVGRGHTWELWNEANNLYWGTLYDTTLTTPLPMWPSPVVFSAWLTDNTALEILVIAGMSAWVVGFGATLFLAATRVLMAAAEDGVLPRAFARTTGDSVPPVALGFLVLAACGSAALDAYWESYAKASAVAVVVLAASSFTSALAAARAFRSDRPAVAAVSALFATIVAAVTVTWVVDPIFGLWTVEAAVFVVVLYAAAATAYVLRARAAPAAVAEA